MTIDELAESFRGAAGLVPIGIALLTLAFDEVLRERGGALAPGSGSRWRWAVAGGKWALVCVASLIIAIRFVAVAF